MMLTIREAAERLNIKPRSVHALIRTRTLVARDASPEEIADLLRNGRITSVPPTGIKVIDADVFDRYQRERRPAHRPRKEQP